MDKQAGKDFEPQAYIQLLKSSGRGCASGSAFMSGELIKHLFEDYRHVKQRKLVWFSERIYGYYLAYRVDISIQIGYNDIMLSCR